jgi:hypothetical protein
VNKIHVNSSIDKVFIVEKASLHVIANEFPKSLKN